ncbi:MAG: hypothetical protein AB7G80_07320 [Dongiaceae bacterium]
MNRFNQAADLHAERMETIMQSDAPVILRQPGVLGFGFIWDNNEIKLLVETRFGSAGYVRYNLPDCMNGFSVVVKDETTAQSPALAVTPDKAALRHRLTGEIGHPILRRLRNRLSPDQKWLMFQRRPALAR